MSEAPGWGGGEGGAAGATLPQAKKELTLTLYNSPDVCANS